MITFHCNVLLCENRYSNESIEVNERNINSFFFLLWGKGEFLIDNLSRVSLISLMFY